MSQINAPKTCFVIMGFGLKTDYATGRKLDLDKSYRLLIKPTVEAKGVTCIRGDEIRHSGTIDVPMFQSLLEADVVIADISTANTNAFYELGIRHALKPCTTIIISENKMPYPFDINHVKIEGYAHLGDAIDYEEVLRFRKILGDTLEQVIKEKCTDSPVYTYLKELIPPSLNEKVQAIAEEVTDSLTKASNINAAATAQEESGSDPTLALLTQQAEEALKKQEFSKAKTLFQSALILSGGLSEGIAIVNDTYLLHRLALSTYKAKEPNEITALNDALGLLMKLDLDHTNDSETVALAGAIEKKFYELGEGEEHLSKAILFFMRGFFLLHNRYNGINLAYLLNCRAASSLDSTNDEKIADMVWANWIRRDVLQLCTKNWEAIKDRETIVTKVQKDVQKRDLSRDQKQSLTEQKFWILVNKAEAHFGLGDKTGYESAVNEAKAIPHEEWMMASFATQVNKLNELLVKIGHLVTPPWSISN